LADIVSMNNIVKSYDGVKALDGANLTVEQGEVHALIGANGAGKSTLMKILCGELDYDSGKIVYDGKEINPQKYGNMQSFGIILIHQEICSVPELTVAQYMFVGREPTKGFFIDDKQMEKNAVCFLEQIGAEFSPSTKMGDLSLAQQQLVEISKALSFNVKLLILDEPTTALGERETQKVFEIIRSLKNKGVSVIYISHRLEELFIISDRITVMRDGKYIRTLQTSSSEKNELISLLAGHEIKSGKKTASSVPENAEIVLEVQNVSASPLPENVSFSLRKGEILGLAGLVGSGRTETAKSICGIIPKLSGKVFINNKEAKINSPKDAIKNGICYLSEDRNGEGLIPQRSIIGNTVISSLERYEEFFILDDKKMLKDSVELNSKVKTKYSDPHAPISSLSGGNAQKVIIARWLLNDCQIFIFDEPTKGIDVGAKDEIYQNIADIAKSGHSVIVISSETEELLDNCDRILVMWEGKISGELSIENATQERIMKFATGENI